MNPPNILPALRQHWSKVVLLAISLWTAFYISVVIPRSQYMGISEQKATGLGAVAGWEPISLWHENRAAAFLDSFTPSPSVVEGQGVVGGLPGQSSSLEDTFGRKLTRTSSMAVEVKDPTDASEKIRLLAERLGGYVTSSELARGDDIPTGSMTILVPASRFQDARVGIEKLCSRVNSERVEARDITKQFVDNEVRLHSLQAEEQQYLAILKRAARVSDIVEISDKLNSVREQIERTQAESKALSKQVEMVSIQIWLRVEIDTQVFGLHWRPLYVVKFAARGGLESLANYTSDVTAAVFQLPAVALWLSTVIFLAVLFWRILRWVWRTFFVLA